MIIKEKKSVAISEDRWLSSYLLFSRRFTQMNADRFKYKEILVYDNKRKKISGDQRRSVAEQLPFIQPQIHTDERR